MVYEKEKSITIKVVTILTALSALIAIINAFSGPILSLYLSYKFNIDTGNGVQ